MAKIIDTGPNDPEIYDEPSRDIYYTTYSPVARFLWTILWLINALLALRFLLRLFSANPAAAFTDFIYTLSGPLVSPFINVIRSTSINNVGVWEWPTLLGMVVYWLIAYLLVRLFTISRPVAKY